MHARLSLAHTKYVVVKVGLRNPGILQISSIPAEKRLDHGSSTCPMTVLLVAELVKFLHFLQKECILAWGEGGGLHVRHPVKNTRLPARVFLQW